MIFQNEDIHPPVGEPPPHNYIKEGDENDQSSGRLNRDRPQTVEASPVAPENSTAQKWHKMHFCDRNKFLALT